MWLGVWLQGGCGLGLFLGGCVVRGVAWRCFWRWVWLGCAFRSLEYFFLTLELRIQPRILELNQAFTVTNYV